MQWLIRNLILSLLLIVVIVGGLMLASVVVNVVTDWILQLP